MAKSHWININSNHSVSKIAKWGIDLKTQSKTSWKSSLAFSPLVCHWAWQEHRPGLSLHFLAPSPPPPLQSIFLPKVGYFMYSSTSDDFTVLWVIRRRTKVRMLHPPLAGNPGAKTGYSPCSSEGHEVIEIRSGGWPHIVSTRPGTLYWVFYLN